MDCQTLTNKGLVKCPHFEECHRLKVALCEVDQEFHQPAKQPPTPWTTRRQQLLEIANSQATFTTATVMNKTGAANVTACTWLRRLLNEGEIRRLTPAVLTAQGSQPATFAIPSKED